MPDVHEGNGIGLDRPTARAWAALVDECMDRMDRHPPEHAETRLAWLAGRLHEFLAAEAWWVAACAGDDIVTVASSCPATPADESRRCARRAVTDAAGSGVVDQRLLVARGCDPDAQEWWVVLQGQPDETDLSLAQPIVSALVYAAVGFPRAPSVSGQCWPARHLPALG